MSSRLTSDGVAQGYPYWSKKVKLNDGTLRDMALYWHKTVEIRAIVKGLPGKYQINYAFDGKEWAVAADVEASSMEEAQRIAEALLRIALATTERKK
jgi:hypothetical protein